MGLLLLENISKHLNFRANIANFSKFEQWHFCRENRNNISGTDILTFFSRENSNCSKFKVSSLIEFLDRKLSFDSMCWENLRGFSWLENLIFQVIFKRSKGCPIYWVVDLGCMPRRCHLARLPSKGDEDYDSFVTRVTTGFISFCNKWNFFCFMKTKIRNWKMHFPRPLP